MYLIHEGKTTSILVEKKGENGNKIARKIFESERNNQNADENRRKAIKSHLIHDVYDVHDIHDVFT